MELHNPTMPHKVCQIPDEFPLRPLWSHRKTNKVNIDPVLKYQAKGFLKDLLDFNGTLAKIKRHYNRCNENSKGQRVKDLGLMLTCIRELRLGLNKADHSVYTDDQWEQLNRSLNLNDTELEKLAGRYTEHGQSMCKKKEQQRKEGESGEREKNDWRWDPLVESSLKRLKETSKAAEENPDHKRILDFQRSVCLACLTLIENKRSTSWITLKVDNNKNHTEIDHTNDNYITFDDYGHAYLTWNKRKESSRRLVEPVPKLLATILKIWYDRFRDNGLYLFVNDKGEPVEKKTFSEYILEATQTCFGKKLGVGDLRRVQITVHIDEFRNMNAADQDAYALKYHHSSDTHRTYYREEAYRTNFSDNNA